MLSLIISALIFLPIITGRQVPPPLCPDNEVYDLCGTACPLNCYNLYDTIACPEVCVTGCFCQDGYVRDKEINGTCIPVTECPVSASVCSENEEYAECGTACPATCLDQEPKACPDICVAGCFCKEGYIRSTKNGPCVPKGICNLAICTENKVYKACGSPCPGVCSQPMRVCQRKCVPGCFCQDGYVLEDGTDKCVKLEDCPHSE